MWADPSATATATSRAARSRLAPRAKQDHEGPMSAPPPHAGARAAGSPVASCAKQNHEGPTSAPPRDAGAQA